MCSTPWLPTPGTSLVLRVSFVDVHPKVIPVQLWGLVGERRDEYVRLSREIQEAAAARSQWARGGASASPGELCLVQVGLLWRRCRVVSQQAQKSCVFLLDEGRTITANSSSLMPGRSEFFHLPSEVLGCVLAGLVPTGSGGAGGGEPQQWPASAVDFLSNLKGKEVHGQVLDVLLLHRLVLLQVPSLFQQMQELGLARQVPGSLFRSLLKRYLKATSTAGTGPGASVLSHKPEHPGLDYFYPQLQLGVTEPVVVTQVCHPHRIHCQLRSLSQEIHRLSESMAQAYRGSTGTGHENSTSATWEEREESPDKPGSPCASCGLDGRWYRGLLLEIFRPQRCAQVLHVDYGRKELVSCSSLRYMLPEYFRMPVVTYPCALYGLWDGGRGWSRSQVGDLKALILGQAVNAKIEFYCSFEHVYYVTLYGDDGINFNCVFGVQSCCLADRFLQSQGIEEEEEEEEPETVLQSQSLAEEVDEEISHPGLRSIRLKVNAFYDAQVEFVKSPSEFWIRLRKHSGTFSKLMKRMCSFYSSAKALTDTAVVRNVSPGLVVQEKEKRTSVFSSLAQNFLEIKPGSFCKEELEIGSTVEVKVSYVENPGYFWCQMTRNIQGFKTLMCNIQDYCKNMAAPHQGTTPACLAKRTVNGKWSRALISGAQSSEHVKVIFVDYGDKDMVSVKNIYAISEEFLKVNAQAFRCSLYNLIQPTGQNPFVWDEKAIQAFSEFLDNAWQDNLELKCTVFALASIEDEGLFNVVDLLTPFQSACHFLVEKRLARPVKLEMPLESSVQLHSYYYSTHDMKIGSEEFVCVTYVDDPWKFYCQLARNADVLEQLSRSITQLSKTLLNLKTSPFIPGNLCLAKYTDGNWYRGILIEKKPNKVFFVDFGNIYVATSGDILPIPSDAYDVLLLPMQAVKCSLSDIPDHIPGEVTTWFRETILDKSLKALVVAKDPDGRLIIELYDDSIQINANISEKLGLHCYKERRKESEAFFSTTETVEEKNENIKLSPSEYLSKSVEKKLYSLEILGESYKPKVNSACKELKFLRSSTKTNLVAQYQDSVGNNNNKVFPVTTKKKEEIFTEPCLKATPSERKIGDSCNKNLPLKFCELPQKIIMPGFKTTVYVSHINDLSDFYVQLTEDEAEINHLSERLNDVKTRPEYHAGPPLQRGDVICAIFPEDNLWYRAVVKKLQPNDLFSVQFIDYGNVSVVHINKIGRLNVVNAILPGLCIHCSLGGLWVPDIIHCKEMMHYFSQRTNRTQIRCEFIQFQDRWEVILADEHGIIAEDMISRYAFSEKSQIGLSTQVIKGACSKSVSNTDTAVFLNWYNPKVKMVRAYATVIDGPEYFWCQFADTEKLQYLEIEVQTAGEQVTDLGNCIPCPHIGDPCIVRHREDGHYYRALITNICEDYLVSVRLVDFGNIEDCVDPKALWNIPSELLLVPMQAFPCCLSGFNISESVCPQEGNDYFYEIITEDVLEITILEIRKDVCDIPLAIVDLKSKGESINEKMKKYSKIGVTKSDVPCEKSDLYIKGAPGSPSPDVGLKKASNKAVQDKTFYVEPETHELSERTEKDLNMIDTKPSKFYDLKLDNIFKAFENPHEDKIGTEVLEGKVEGHLADEAKFDNKYFITGFNTSSPHASETKEILELISPEVPLSPDGDSKEFLELESIELQHSLVGDEEKEELGLLPSIVSLSQGCDREAPLEPFTMQLPLNCEAEKQPELELPAAPLSLDDKINPLSLSVNEKAQESMCADDVRKSSCVESFDDQHRIPSHLQEENFDPQMQTEMYIYEEEFTEYKNRVAISSLTPLFSKEESRDGRKHNNTLPDHVSGM
ncbi:PREDICTED: tudor domain-containing protein 6 [Galeopterus variegatus]|uniref:Tudor domain-containing protein 6 n=1 Tax=Galeopterus variegatus TaxID=482537 RepID=A0ABM0R0P9_GALVR|nr:PREDICTED: tudor domain-containing protein 6 [Galeopterus variegatus]